MDQYKWREVVQVVTGLYNINWRRWDHKDVFESEWDVTWEGVVGRSVTTCSQSIEGPNIHIVLQYDL